MKRHNLQKGIYKSWDLLISKINGNVCIYLSAEERLVIVFRNWLSEFFKKFYVFFSFLFFLCRNVNSSISYLKKPLCVLNLFSSYEKRTRPYLNILWVLKGLNSSLRILLSYESGLLGYVQGLARPCGEEETAGAGKGSGALCTIKEKQEGNVRHT